LVLKLMHEIMRSGFRPTPGNLWRRHSDGDAFGADLKKPRIPQDNLLPLVRLRVHRRALALSTLAAAYRRIESERVRDA
jgi:hypothetical protein